MEQRFEEGSAKVQLQATNNQMDQTIVAQVYWLRDPDGKHTLLHFFPALVQGVPCVIYVCPLISQRYSDFFEVSSGLCCEDHLSIRPWAIHDHIGQAHQ